MKATRSAGVVVATSSPAAQLRTRFGGQAGNDTLLGKGGDDALSGGVGNDTLTGGDGDDQANGDDGDDSMIWNPGDDTDLNEGGPGHDTTLVFGGNGDEQFTASANGARVRFDRVDPAPFSIDLGTVEVLGVVANGGNDSFNGAAGLAPLITPIVDGGPGNDTIGGTDANEVLLGGPGNDFVDSCVQDGRQGLAGREAPTVLDGHDIRGLHGP